MFRPARRELAATIPYDLKDTGLPGLPHEGDVCRYREGIFAGYRYYDKRGRRVLFPFGYSLSYTTPCSDLEASRQIDAGTYTVSDRHKYGRQEGSQVISSMSALLPALCSVR